MQFLRGIDILVKKGIFIALVYDKCNAIPSSAVQVRYATIVLEIFRLAKIEKDLKPVELVNHQLIRMKKKHKSKDINLRSFLS